MATHREVRGPLLALTLLLGLSAAGCESPAAAPPPEPAAPQPLEEPPAGRWEAAWSGRPSASVEAVARPASAVPPALEYRPAAAAAQSVGVQSVEAQVARKRLAGLSFEGVTSLRAAMRSLAHASGVDIVVMEAAEDAARDAGFELDVQSDRPTSLGAALDLVTELAGEEVAWTVRHGVVVVTTREDARPAMRTFVYEVSDLLRGVPDFPGRDMNVRASGVGAELFEEEPREPVPVVNEDALVELVRSKLLASGLEEDEFDVRVWDGKLVVRY